MYIRGCLSVCHTCAGAQSWIPGAPAMDTGHPIPNVRKSSRHSQPLSHLSSLDISTSRSVITIKKLPLNRETDKAQRTKGMRLNKDFTPRLCQAQAQQVRAPATTPEDPSSVPAERREGQSPSELCECCGLHSHTGKHREQQLWSRDQETWTPVLQLDGCDLSRDLMCPATYVLRAVVTEGISTGLGSSQRS